MLHKFALKLFSLLVCGLTSFAFAGPIESIAPDALEARIASNKGYLTVNITSTDPKCGYCARANPKFLELANSMDKGQFAQVSWQPWVHFPEVLKDYFNRNDIQGIPVRLLYKDSQLVEKVVVFRKIQSPRVSSR